MSNNNGIRLEGLQGQRDEQKISTVSVQYFAKGYAEAFSVGGDGYRGLQETSRSWQAWDAGADDEFIVTVQYKGYSDDQDEPEEKETEQWSINFEFTEERLQTHPDIKNIKEKYGGTEIDGELSFPESLPANISSGGLGGKKMSAGDTNPMYGAKTYLVMYARITRSWSARQIPKNAINDIGKVYDEVPNAPDGISSIDFGDRNWLALPPKISQNGDVWRIENEWLLSPPSGWVEEVYTKANDK